MRLLNEDDPFHAQIVHAVGISLLQFPTTVSDNLKGFAVT